MVKEVDWSKYILMDPKKVDVLLNRFGVKKIFGMNVMLVRGPYGFRKLDYEFAKNDINIKEVLDRIEESHVNVLGLTIKDTDGACLWDTKVGWNPTERDLLGEFCDAGKERNIKIMAVLTAMNDAYQGYLHPERVSVHGKNGKKLGREYKKGDISTHDDGEMRIDLPNGVSLEEYQKKIPFLTDKIDEKVGSSRGARGQGYIPQTSFMCPNSKHTDYLLELTKEVVKRYPIIALFPDYLRYDGSFTDLCACERCVSKFRIEYGKEPKLIKSEQWYDFKADTIANFAQRFHDTVKSINPDLITGWFPLTGPKKFFSRKRLGQDWEKLSSILDFNIPMIYPYLVGTHDDGFFWGTLADLMYWYSIRNIKSRGKDFGDKPVLAVTNSVECNAEEMLKTLRTFDFGLGIALFKYFGTSESQWKAIKKYAEEEIGLENLGVK